MHKIPHTKESRMKISETMKRIGGNSGTWKKGQKAWNFKDGKRLKRKYKRFKGKLILNSHFVWLKYNKLDSIPKGSVIHHKDGNSLNDEISNLVLMIDREHRKLLSKSGDLK